VFQPSLSERRSPWVIFTRTNDPWLHNEIQRLESAGGDIIRLDGRDLTAPSQVFSTFSEAMSFPDYVAAGLRVPAQQVHAGAA
jgi:hypothetical protein